MALLYATSFEHGSTTTMQQEGWDTTLCSINTTDYHTEGGVGEAHALDITGASGSGPRTPTLVDPQRIAFWFRAQNLGSPAAAAIVFENAAGGQFHLVFNTDGTVAVYRGDEIFGTLLETSASLMSRAVANWIGIRAVADNSGTVVVEVNGTQVYSYTGDLQYQAATGWTRARLGVATITSDHVIDNVLIYDSAASSLPGPTVAQVKTITSVVSGNLTGSAATGADRYQNADEIPPSSADYNSAASAGDGDLYGTSTLSTMQDIVAVVVCAEAERSGGITTMELAVSQGGTTDYATAQTLPGSGFGSVQAIWETNPDTAAAWTQTEANSADIGARFQA